MAGPYASQALNRSSPGPHHRRDRARDAPRYCPSLQTLRNGELACPRGRTPARGRIVGGALFGAGLVITGVEGRVQSTMETSQLRAFRGHVRAFEQRCEMPWGQSSGLGGAWSGAERSDGVMNPSDSQIPTAGRSTSTSDAERDPQRSLAERVAAGKASRDRVPRGGHGEWQPAPDRADPVDLLEAQGLTRVPELVPIRYGRMLVSPFTFYRGAALPDGRDLARRARTGLHVQLCGDAHLSNFGAFAAPDRRLMFSSTTSTRRCPARSSGMSSGWWPASRSPVETGFRRRSAQAVNLPSPRLQRGHPGVRRDAEARPLVRPAGRRRDRGERWAARSSRAS